MGDDELDRLETAAERFQQSSLEYSQRANRSLITTDDGIDFLNAATTEVVLRLVAEVRRLREWQDVADMFHDALNSSRYWAISDPVIRSEVDRALDAYDAADKEGRND